MAMNGSGGNSGEYSKPELEGKKYRNKLSSRFRVEVEDSLQRLRYTQSNRVKAFVAMTRILRSYPIWLEWYSVCRLKRFTFILVIMVSIQDAQCSMKTSLGETPRATTTKGNASFQYRGLEAICSARCRMIWIALDHRG